MDLELHFCPECGGYCFAYDPPSRVYRCYNLNCFVGFDIDGKYGKGNRCPTPAQEEKLINEIKSRMMERIGEGLEKKVEIQKDTKLQAKTIKIDRKTGSRFR